MPRRSRKTELDAAAREVFAEKGYEGTRLNEVAEKSGMLPGSIYAHYSSKQELYFSVLVTEMKSLIDRVQEVAASDINPDEKLLAAMLVHTDRSERGAINDFNAWRHLDRRRMNKIRALRRDYAAAWDELIADGIKRGAFAGDPWAIRVAAISIADYTLTWFKADGELSTEALIRRLADVLLDGLRPRTSG